MDTWLWAVRLFKTRNRSSEACKKGRVRIDGNPVKPARRVQPGNIVEISIKPIIRSYRVKALAAKRVSATLARDLVEEITPQEELDKLSLFRKSPIDIIFAHREKGSGRPTKKERREIDRFKNDTQL